MHNKKFGRGFSIVEVVIVLVVLGILSWIGYSVWSAQSKNAGTGTAQQSQSETWQKGGVVVSGAYADACVVKVNDTTWRMYYGVQPEGRSSLEVYSSTSTSTDGKAWTQDTGVRMIMAAFPEVIKLPDGRWRMYYQQAGTIKSAISTDGLAFTEESGVRIDALTSESPALTNAAAPAILRTNDGTYTLVYRATIDGSGRYSNNSPNPTTQLLMWATSTDGLSFTKKGIAIDTRNTALDGQLDGPTLLKWDDDSTRLYATTYAGVYMFTFDGSKFSQGTLAFAGDASKDSMGYHGAPPGDPTLAKIGATWLMYYGGGPEAPGIHYATLK